VKRAVSSVIQLALEPEEKKGADSEHQSTRQTQPSEVQPHKFNILSEISPMSNKFLKLVVARSNILFL